MSEVTLEVSALRKRYGEREVVSDVNFSARRGEIIGLLGPNGAGKTTTVSMICGLTPMDQGSVLLCGESLAAGTAAKRRVGLVPQDLALFENLPARTNLRTFGALYGLSGAQLETSCDVALALVGLADRAKDKPETFSGGMKRRLNLACALLHDPDVLLLDEPTVGIDPQSRNAIFENLETLQSQGKTIVYTTHYMEEAERLCDRIVIMDHGKVVANDTLEGLSRMVPRSDELMLTVRGGVDLATLLALKGVRSASQSGDTLSIALDSLATDTESVLANLRMQSIAVEGIASNRASLESFFLTLTGRQLRDETV